MPFNGAGVYSPIGSPDFPAVANTVIRAAQYNNEINDLATALTNCVTRDGQSPATNDLPMNTWRHTGVGAATARTHYGRMQELQDQEPWTITTVAGTDTITGVLPYSYAAYGVGHVFQFRAAAANTGATTLNINAIGAKAVKYPSGADLIAGEFAAGLPVLVMYDGTDFILLTRNPILAISSGGTYVERTSATGSAKLPNGTTAQQDGAPAFGYLRANSTLNRLEWYNGSLWTQAGGGAVGGGNDATFLQVDDIATNDWTLGQDVMVSGVTVTIAAPGVFTLANHGFVTEQHIRFTTTGALPTGLSVNADYYVIAAGLTANDFQVSATRGGAAVNTSGAQSGVHSVGKIKSAIVAPTFVVRTGNTVTVPNGAELVSP